MKKQTADGMFSSEKLKNHAIRPLISVKTVIFDSVCSIMIPIKGFGE
jgi:hypothetical protein